MMARTSILRILTVLYLGTLAVLCFANFNNVQEVQHTLWGIPADKIVHFLMFMPFPVLAFWSLTMKRLSLPKTFLAFAVIFAVGCLIAWGTEYVQGLLPYRQMDSEDFRADRIGLACGTLIAFVVLAFSRNKANA